MTNEQLLTIVVSLGGLILIVSLALGGLILAQSRATRSELRDIRSELHSGLRDAARERTELRDRMGRLEERMARLEGTLDVLREFFVGGGRGTAA